MVYEASVDYLVGPGYEDEIWTDFNAHDNISTYDWSTVHKYIYIKATITLILAYKSVYVQ